MADTGTRIGAIAFLTVGLGMSAGAVLTLMHRVEVAFTFAGVAVWRVFGRSDVAGSRSRDEDEAA